MARVSAQFSALAASSSIGTYAGQVIMEGFLRRRIPLAVRRLVTMVPAFALIAAGADPVRLLGLNGVLLWLAVTA